jgi:hypothetical protein
MMPPSTLASASAKKSVLTSSSAYERRLSRDMERGWKLRTASAGAETTRATNPRARGNAACLAELSSSVDALT